ncbi:MULTISPECIES: c-type cytochrome [Acidobacteriaceae]|uniref:c-type cytochrome n=1 Tax=Acidobacteriaceae TaxID=204434 RepID=UPI00131E425D|nr:MULTISPECIES: c-type cytochrome [Acidobacteriaceae]MDW5265215.1 c-type cytochrome [Edaphobacter sp.]
MNQKNKLVFGAMCALLCGLCLSNPALGQNLPDGKGKAEFIHNCTACHRADMVTVAKKTKVEWRKSVDDMAARGTDGTPQDIDNAYLYLATYFATDKSAQATAAPSTSGAATPLSSSEIEQAKSLITQSECLACHQIQGQGGYTGPSLNGVGARRTPDQIRAAIVTPKPTLDPANDLVRLSTADGKTVTGRILSQDDHTVQVMDTSGKTATYSKSDLTLFTIIDTNPMPPYGGRIAGDDLDTLVRYLSSLPSTNEGAQK